MDLISDFNKPEVHNKLIFCKVSFNIPQLEINHK